MTIERQVLEKLRDLPPDEQKEVLDFVDFLKEKNGPKKRRCSLLGLGGRPEHAYHGRRYPQAGREMWGKYPRREL